MVLFRPGLDVAGLNTADGGRYRLVQEDDRHLGLGAGVGDTSRVGICQPEVVYLVGELLEDGQPFELLRCCPEAGGGDPVIFNGVDRISSSQLRRVFWP